MSFSIAYISVNSMMIQTTTKYSKLDDMIVIWTVRPSKINAVFPNNSQATCLCIEIDQNVECFSHKISWQVTCALFENITWDLTCKVWWTDTGYVFRRG